MLTPSMSYKEIYDNITAEKEKIEFEKYKLQPKAIKEFKKCKKFPAWRWYEYKNPTTRNEFIIFFYCQNRETVDKPRSYDFLTLFSNNKRFTIRCLLGGLKHTPNSQTFNIPQLHIYTEHFLNRYNERCLKINSLKTIDIACRFIANNYFVVPVPITEEINRNISEYGEGARHGYIVAEGLCFTDSALEGFFNADGNKEYDRCDVLSAIYRTFMPLSQLSESQKIALTKEYIKTWDFVFREKPDLFPNR